MPVCRCGCREITVAGFDHIEFGLCLASLAALLRIPRRPRVFYNGKPVDNQLGASLYDRYSYFWASSVQARAIWQPLDLSEIPSLSHNLRCRILEARYQHQKGAGRLWLQQLGTFRGTLVYQWLFVLLKSFMSFAVQVSLHGFYLQLEADKNKVWAWVFALAFCLMAEVIVGCWLKSVSETLLEMPTIAHLTLLVFQKSTRRKISYGFEKNQPGESQPLASSEINLLRADISAVSMIWGFSNNFPIAIFKILLDVAFLIKLMGAKSIISGFAVCAILIPLSTNLSKKRAFLQSRLSRYRDRTMAHVGEALQGIHQIRFLSLEATWIAKINRIRTAELQQAWKTAVSMGIVNSCVDLGPILLVSVSILVYALEHQSLAPSIAFVSIGLVADLHASIRTLPRMAANIYESWISYRRVEDYSNEPEVESVLGSSEGILFNAATFEWPKALPMLLRSRDTGSGKSLLLAAILGEADLISGEIRTTKRKIEEKLGGTFTGRIAYVSQPPWIDDTSIRDNIIFGLRFDEVRYWDVIKACALEQDLEQMHEGDATKAGFKGAALSGGQCWRVALARAVYSSASVILLDDVLSAVDGRVARWIVEQALTGPLFEGRTIILATHTPDICLKYASYLVELGGSTVKKSMTEDDIRLSLQKKYESTEQVDKITENKRAGDLPKEEIMSVPSPRLSGQLKASVKASGTQATDVLRPTDLAPRQKAQKVYSGYFKATGGWIPLLVGMTVTVACELLSAGRSWWLMRWTSDRPKTGPEVPDGEPSLLKYRVAVYLVLSLLSGVGNTAQTLVFARLGLAASQSLFERMLEAVLRAPLLKIMAVPMGQYLNAFVSDLPSVDRSMTEEMSGILNDCFHLAIVFGTSFLSAPYVVLSAVILSVMYFKVATYYRMSSRAFQKLIPVAQAPVLEHMNSITSGLATIRAFGRADYYQNQVYDLIDQRTKLGWHLSLGIKWMNIRTGIIGASFVTITAATLALQGADAAFAGFTITMAMQLSDVLSQLIRRYGLISGSLNAVGRVMEFIESPTETQDGDDAPKGWPSSGEVRVEDLTVTYRGSPALTNINLRINPRSRVGIVGRTGAGKTTLAHSLLRFLEPESGKIIFDGVDISTLKLFHLRQGISIIPQEPFLFSGTLRSNLDLHSDKQDEELRNALWRVGLQSLEKTEKPNNSSGSFYDLDIVIGDGGKNMSHGQRQLICLARALLSRSRLLIFDEATSSVDRKMDQMIQEVIRNEFSDSTIIFIAHRLSTLNSFDEIVVLDSRRVVETVSASEFAARRQ
ncbi:ABC transporter [Aulographum hederae CBS 113979]|uniref:ABC transporter n=1 Tax=Aulographum hederae CBS 113979 TaxID=1176131 RepID=A0A6G1HCP4_9PEZI|nr:ABC transporter [Aulographum hederae CBS 113979]